MYIREETLERIRKGWREGSDEENLVFTGSGAGGGFLYSRKGSYDGRKDYSWTLRGIDGPVEAQGTVVLHQRNSLAVVSIKARA